MGPQQWKACGASADDEFVSITTRAFGFDGDVVAGARITVTLYGPGDLDGAAGLSDVAKETDAEGVASFVWWPPPDNDAEWLKFGILAACDDERTCHLELDDESSTEQARTVAARQTLTEDELGTVSSMDDLRALVRKCIEPMDGFQRLWFEGLRPRQPTWSGSGGGSG